MIKVEFKALTLCLGLAYFTSFSYADLPSYVNSLASLNYYIDTINKSLEDENSTLDDSREHVEFSTSEVECLWKKVEAYTAEENRDAHLLFEKAYRNYQKSELADKSEAKRYVEATVKKLDKLWTHALALESATYNAMRSKKQTRDDTYDTIPSPALAKMRPYLISEDHPMWSSLNRIFQASRVTLNESSFENAGFKILDKRPRSFILVARHPDLPGHLIKANLDDNLHIKQGKRSWEWFVLRCEGAAKVKKIIDQFALKHFTVADKWIYPLPSSPLPPNDGLHTRHLAVLLVTDMKLVSSTKNLHAWRIVIDEEHLDELYTIMSRAKGSSYRPDNIAYTQNHNFAFIDTEYPSRGPDYDSIRKHLTPKMLRYWDKLVRQGGPSL